MYEYLTGLVTVVAPQYIVVDVNGVGYKLLVANPYRYQEDRTKKVQVYVYQAVREDNISLFGFTDQNEKKSIYAINQCFRNWAKECFSNFS